MKKYQLSSAQRRLWFLYKAEPESCAFNLSTAWRCRGQLHIKALQRAFAAVIRRHETLRSIFVEEDGVPFQVVVDEAMLNLLILNFPEGEAAAFCESQANYVFDLHAAPPIRGHLVRLSDDDHIIHVVMHHIIADGWSLNVFRRDLIHCYGVFAGAPRGLLVPLRSQYHEFVQEEIRQSAKCYQEDLEYWREQLAGAPLLELPAEHPRRTPTYLAGSVPVHLPAGLIHNLKRIAR